MNQLSGLDITLFLFGISIFTFFLLIAISSAREKEKRATFVSLIMAFVFCSLFIVVAIVDSSPQGIFSWVLISLSSLTILSFTFPIDKKLRSNPDTPVSRLDERDVIFSRMKLKPGDGRYEEYYEKNPGKKALDDQLRSAPPLLSPETPFYHAFYSEKGRNIFDEVDLLYDKVDGNISKVRQNLDVDEITKEITRYAKQLHAKQVSVVSLLDHHLYSTKGRGENYGREIQKKHTFSIVMTVEMDRLLNRTAPTAPTTCESAVKYLQSGEIAVEIAAYIRKLGYSARAHIDANYELLCPLIGRDAGLGEIGRMGILMSPELGPRFRISVVTTSLPLKSNKRKRDLSMLEFCQLCNKCSNNCPANAIPKAGMREINGVKRWQINQDACFSYWKKVGTDCGKCMAVCPYSHPGTSFHRWVKRLIKRNILFRHLAVYMDDLFYGKYPKSYPLEKLTQA